MNAAAAEPARIEHLRILATGPDVFGANGAGIQRHVLTLLDCFDGSDAVSVTPFAATSTVYDERWGVKGVRLLWKYARFPFAVARCDVVHINSTIDDRSLVRDSGFALLAAALGRPVVMQFHGGGTDRLVRTRQGVVGRYVTWAQRKSSVALFFSERQKVELRALIPFERVALVRNYVEAGEPRRDPRDGLGLNVVYVGRLAADKGALETIRGFVAAWQPGWTLRIAGSGPEESAVRKLSEGSDGVEFLGYVSGSRLDDLYRWADVLVLPSAHAEGLPYAVLEAAAAGAALITSDRGALPSVTLDGVTGSIVPPLDAGAVAEALRSLDEDKERLHRMGEAARDLIERDFSMERMGAEFGPIYRSVLRGGGQ